MATQESKAQAVFKKVLAAACFKDARGMCARIGYAERLGIITSVEHDIAQEAVDMYMHKLGGTAWYLHDILRDLGLTALDATQWRQYGLAAFYSTWDKRPMPWRKGQRHVAAILKLAVDSGVYATQKEYMCHAVKEMFNTGSITSRERDRTLDAIQQYIGELGRPSLGYTPMTLHSAMQAGAFSSADFCEYIGRDLYSNWGTRPMNMAAAQDVVQAALRRRDATRPGDGRRACQDTEE